MQASIVKCGLQPACSVRWLPIGRNQDWRLITVQSDFHIQYRRHFVDQTKLPWKRLDNGSIFLELCFNYRLAFSMAAVYKDKSGAWSFITSSSTRTTNVKGYKNNNMTIAKHVFTTACTSRSNNRDQNMKSFVRCACRKWRGDFFKCATQVPDLFFLANTFWNLPTRPKVWTRPYIDFGRMSHQDLMNYTPPLLSIPE